jgi:hypothetical protein
LGFSDGKFVVEGGDAEGGVTEAIHGS